MEKKNPSVIEKIFPVLVFIGIAASELWSESESPDDFLKNWPVFLMGGFFVLLYFSGGGTRGEQTKRRRKNSRVPNPAPVPEEPAPKIDFEIPAIKGAPGTEASRADSVYRDRLTQEDIREEADQRRRLIRQKEERDAREAAARACEAAEYASQAKLQSARKSPLISELKFDLASMRNAFLYAEIFGKPKALRKIREN